jgi:putative Mn2+ efflux pump MntP
MTLLTQTMILLIGVVMIATFLSNDEDDDEE